MNALGYEYFIRDAFGDVERGGDPAGLAEAGIYNDFNNPVALNELKIGTGYAIAIYNHRYMNEKELRDPEDYERMETFFEKVLSATTHAKIGEIIKEYNEFIEELKKLEDI